MELRTILLAMGYFFGIGGIFSGAEHHNGGTFLIGGIILFITLILHAGTSEE